MIVAPGHTSLLSYQAGASEYLMYVISEHQHQNVKPYELKQQPAEIFPHVETSCMTLTKPPDPTQAHRKKAQPQTDWLADECLENGG